MKGVTNLEMFVGLLGGAQLDVIEEKLARESSAALCNVSAAAAAAALK